MLFMVIHFKERNLRGVFKTVSNPYDGSFSKIEEIEIWQVSLSEEVNVFQTHSLKMLEFYNGMMERSKIEQLFVFVLKLNKKCALQIILDKINAPKIVVEEIF